MQPPQKNIFLVIVLSMLVFMSWSMIESVLSPPKSKNKTQEVTQEAKTHPWTGMTAQGLAAQIGALAPAAAMPGYPAQAVSQFALGQLAAHTPEFWALRDKTPPKPLESAKPAEEIVLGGEGYNLNVTLTTRGGGISQVLLPKFQEADKFGRPVFIGPADKIPEELHLIPKDEENPSYLLYNYPDAKATNPVNTLGREVWNVVEGPTKNADEEQVAFAQDIPALGIRVTKIYTLRRDAYHVGLEVKFEALHGPVKDFRYQLAGGRGLPIEGEWYTFINRNSLIGVVDKSGNVQRDLQDSRVVGVEDGGHPVYKGDNYIAYAGVVTQYFSSVIAVDNHQEPGVAPNFLEWARPTREGPIDPMKPQLDDMTTRVNSVKLDLKPGHPIVHRYVLYNGPVKVRLLGSLTGDKAVSANPAETQELLNRYETALHLDTLTDYHSPSAIGSFSNLIGWSRLIIWTTNLMHGLLYLLHTVVPSYGICIILLTVLVRGAMFPFSRRQAIMGAHPGENGGAGARGEETRGEIQGRHACPPAGQERTLHAPRRQSAGHDGQLLDGLPANADLHGSLLCLAGEHFLPPGTVPVDPEPRRPGHAHQVGAERPGRQHLPRALLQHLADRRGCPDDCAAEDDDAAADRRHAGAAAEDDEMDDGCFRLHVLQGSGGAVHVLHRHQPLGHGRTQAAAQEAVGRRPALADDAGNVARGRNGQSSRSRNGRRDSHRNGDQEEGIVQRLRDWWDEVLRQASKK